MLLRVVNKSSRARGIPALEVVLPVTVSDKHSGDPGSCPSCSVSGLCCRVGRQAISQTTTCANICQRLRGEVCKQVRTPMCEH